MGMATFNAYLLGIVSPSLRFDLARDLQAVSQLTSQAYLFVVHPSVTGNTLKEVVAFSKTHPVSSTMRRRAPAEWAISEWSC